MSIALLSCVLGLFSVSPALATEDFTFTINSLSEFEVGQLPFVNGKAVTLDKIGRITMIIYPNILKI